MSWQAIAKKDFQDSIRSRTLWVIIGLFLLLIFALSWWATDGNITDTDAFVAVIGGTFILGVIFFVPLTGLFISIKSIVRERESGTINLLLSLPHSRSDMVIGKFVGRSAVLTVAILVGFLPAVILLLVEADVTPLYEIFALLLSTILLGLMFIGIGVGFSALVNSETQATIGGVLIFILLYMWPFIINFILDISVPDFFERSYLLFLFWDMWAALMSVREDVPNASIVELGGNPEVGSASVDVAIYMQHWFAFVILAFWIIVPLAVGYLRFNQRDL